MNKKKEKKKGFFMKTMAVLMSLKVYLKASSHSLGVLIANKIVCVVFFSSQKRKSVVLKRWSTTTTS